MPPTKKKKLEQSTGDGVMFSKQSFFLPNRGLDGGKISVAVVQQPFNNHKPQVKKTVVQPAGPGMMFSKQSFFLPGRGVDGGKVPVPVAQVEQQQSVGFKKFEPQRRFVYDKVTGVEYAEWINGVAYCLNTGEELFRSRNATGEEASSSGQDKPFDFSVPKQRHPNDYSIDTNDILASGFLSLSDFKAPNGAAIRLIDYENYLKREREDGNE
jgi:hypothetical protein